MDKGSINGALKTYIINLIERKLREGMTATDLARLAKVDKSTVGRWRRGETEPRLVEAVFAIRQWGGHLTDAFSAGGMESLVSLLEAIDTDPELGDALEKILNSDHPLKSKLLRDIKDYSKIIKD